MAVAKLPPGACRLLWREASARALVAAPAPVDWPAELIGELVSTPLFDEVLVIVARRQRLAWPAVAAVNTTLHSSTAGQRV
jgi:hypothetical protein